MNCAVYVCRCRRRRRRDDRMGIGVRRIACVPTQTRVCDPFSVAAAASVRAFIATNYIFHELF